MARYVCAAAIAALLGALSTPAQSQTATDYTYDVHGRLIGSARSDGSTGYTYDKAGNRVRLVMGGANHPPVATPDSVTVSYQGALTFDPRTNDTDADTDPLSITAVSVMSNPAKGTAVPTNGGQAILYTAGPGSIGADTLSYTVSDGRGGTSSAAISVTISSPASLPPTVANVSAKVPLNSNNNLINLSIGGSADSVAVPSAPSHGGVSISGLNIRYTPTPGYSDGQDSFTYTATNSQGTSNPAATVTIDVMPTPPVAVHDDIAIPYGGALTFSPLVNDTGTRIKISGVSQPAYGDRSFDDGSIYVGNLGTWSGSQDLSYVITDPYGQTSTSTVTITVPAPAVPAPQVGPITTSTAYNTATSFALSPTGNYTSLALYASPTKGSATISGATMTYTPTNGATGGDNFSYTATGPGGTSAPANISITIGSVAAPSAGTVNASTAYNTATSFALSPTGNYTSLAVYASPTKGSASISGTTMTYTPNNGATGTDTFSYKATGPGGTSAAANINVFIGNPSPPTAGPVYATTNYETPVSFSLSLDGLYSSLALSSGPNRGSVNISGTTANYAPNPGRVGDDTFYYTATGPGGTSAAALITVHINDPPPLPLPTAGDVTASTAYNTPTAFSLAPGGNYNYVTLNTNPFQGTATISGNTATYTPNPGATNYDQFTYTVTGIAGTSTPGTVTITIGAAPANNAPTANNDGIELPMYETGTVSVLANDTDLDGNTLTLTGISTTSGNKANYTISGNDVIVQAKGVRGSETITYTISDGHGGTATGNLTVVVTF
jgi:YD repeat-containing protein